MKKILSVLLAAVMVLTMLAGCSSKPEPTPDSDPSNTPANSTTPSNSSDPTPEGKQYDGVTLTMWSMWSTGEPQIGRASCRERVLLIV